MPSARATAARAPAARRASSAWATARRTSTRAGRCDRSACGRRLEARTASRVFPSDRRALDVARPGSADDRHARRARTRRRAARNSCPRAQLEARWPQIDVAGRLAWAIFEPESGVLMARRAVDLRRPRSGARGARYATTAVDAPRRGRGRHRRRRHAIGRDDRAARTFVFACGPWLPKLFPDLLDGRIFATRQEVLYFGPPPGDWRFAPPALPALDRFRRGDVRRPGHRGARLQDRARPARPAVRPRHRRSRRRPDAAAGPRLSRPALPGAPRRAARAPRRSASTRTAATAIS